MDIKNIFQRKEFFSQDMFVNYFIIGCKLKIFSLFDNIYQTLYIHYTYIFSKKKYMLD